MIADEPEQAGAPTRPGRPGRGGPTRFRVVGVEDGMTLRQLLAKRLGVGPAIAAELVRAGGVYVGQVRMCIPTLRVSEGERVTVYRDAAEVRPIAPETLRVVHRDEACVIVDKPHGVPAAATRSATRGTLAAALVQRLAGERVARPYVGLIHALPPAAAGLALFTIRGQSTESFFKAFAELAMRRRYLVRVSGVLAARRSCDLGLVSTPSGGWRAARDGDREPVTATSEWTPIAALADETLVEVTLTGAATAGAEAVRLHASALTLGVVGDGETLCLLASHLEFVHPRTGLTVSASAERPAWARPELAGAAG